MPKKDSKKARPKRPPIRNPMLSMAEPEGLDQPLPTGPNNFEDRSRSASPNYPENIYGRAEESMGLGFGERPRNFRNLGQASALSRQSTGPTGLGPQNRFRLFNMPPPQVPGPFDARPPGFFAAQEHRPGWGGPRPAAYLPIENNRRPQVLSRRQIESRKSEFEGRPTKPSRTKTAKNRFVSTARRTTLGERAGRDNANILRVIEDNNELYSKLHETLETAYGLGAAFMPESGIDPTRALQIISSNLRVYSAKEAYSREQYGRSHHEILALKGGLSALRERVRAREQQLAIHRGRGENDAASRFEVEISYLNAQITECFLNIARCESFEVSVAIPNYTRLDNMLKRIAQLLNIVRIEEDVAHDDELTEVEETIWIATNILNREGIDPNIKRKMIDLLSKFKLLHIIFKYRAEGWPLGHINKDTLYAAVRAVLTTVDRGDLYEQSIWATSGFRANEVRLKRITRYIQRATGILVSSVSTGTRVVKQMAETIQSASLSGILKTSTLSLRSALASAYKWSTADPWMDPSAYEFIGSDKFMTLAHQTGDRALIGAAEGMVQAIEGIRESQQNSQQSEAEDFDVGECDQSILNRASTFERRRGLLEEPVLPAVPEMNIEYRGYNEPADLGENDESWAEQQGYSEGGFHPYMSNLTPESSQGSNQNNTVARMLNEGDANY